MRILAERKFIKILGARRSPLLCRMTQQATEAPDTFQITATLKWFDRTKGFGFLTAPGYEQDIFLHESVLADAVGFILQDGSTLEVLVQNFAQGVRVSKIISVERPESTEETPWVEDVAGIPAIPARMKWFDAEKGFGFANAFREREDIFVHSSILDRYGIKGLNPNEAVSLRIQMTERGPVAVDICDWVEQTAESE